MDIKGRDEIKESKVTIFTTLIFIMVSSFITVTLVYDLATRVYYDELQNVGQDKIGLAIWVGKHFVILFPMVLVGVTFWLVTIKVVLKGIKMIIDAIW